MVLSATERAAEILSTCIPWMREEANPTVAAVNRTVFQIGTIAQNGIERELILTNKRKDAIVLVPVFAKRKNFPDGYDKIARFSVKMLSGLSISSSYSLEAKASRCRARIFYPTARNLAKRIHTDLPLVRTLPASSFSQADSASLRARLKKLLGKKNQDVESRLEEEPNSSFPSSGSI